MLAIAAAIAAAVASGRRHDASSPPDEAPPAPAGRTLAGVPPGALGRGARGLFRRSGHAQRHHVRRQRERAEFQSLKLTSRWPRDLPIPRSSNRGWPKAGSRPGPARVHAAPAQGREVASHAGCPASLLPAAEVLSPRCHVHIRLHFNPHVEARIAAAYSFTTPRPTIRPSATRSTCGRWTTTRSPCAGRSLISCPRKPR